MTGAGTGTPAPGTASAQGAAGRAAGAPANRAELTPLAFLERAALAFGSRTAVVEGDRRLDYRAFRQRAYRLAAALRASGVARGDRVAVLAPNGLLALVAHYGVPLAGAVLVALNTRLAPAEIAYILGHSGARVLLVDAGLWPPLAPALGDCPGVERVVVAGRPAGAAAAAAGRGRPPRGLGGRSARRTGASCAAGRPLPPERPGPGRRARTIRCASTTPAAPPARPRGWSTPTAGRTSTR